MRDFRGISTKSFDKRGNYALGIKEQIVFPEINYDDVDSIRGLDIVICTSARSDEEGLALLKKFNFPFRIEEPKEVEQKKSSKQELKQSLSTEEETESTSKEQQKEVTSKEEVGSSRISNFGFRIRALAIAILCLWPPENSCGKRL